MKTQQAHTCKIAEGDPTAQEVMFVFSAGRLASGAFRSYSSLFHLRRSTRQYDHESWIPKLALHTMPRRWKQRLKLNASVTLQPPVVLIIPNLNEVRSLNMVRILIGGFCRSLLVHECTYSKE